MTKTENIVEYWPDLAEYQYWRGHNKKNEDSDQ